MRNIFNIKIFSVFIILFLFMLSFFLIAFGFIEFIFLLDVFSIILFVCLIYILCKYYSKQMIVNSYMIYGLFSALCISLILEKGVYLYEINKISYESAITLKVAFQCVVFFLGLCVTQDILLHLKPKILFLKESNNFFIVFFIRFLTIIMICTLLLISIAYGTPYSNSIHRNDYWAYIAPSWGGMVKVYLIQFSFLLGVLCKQYSKKVDYLLFFAILSTVVIMGERFTGILNSIFLFMIPILICNIEKIKFISFKNIISALIVAVGIFFALLLSFGADSDFNESFEKISLRVVLQPQMWWALEQLSSFDVQNIDVISSRYIGVGEEIRNSGTYYLMEQVATPSIVDYRYETNSMFTLAGFMSNIYFFGYFIGTIMNFIWGGILGSISLYLWKSIETNNILAMFISFKFLLKLQVIIIDGNTPNFFSINTIVFVCLCLFFVRFSYRR